MFRGYGPYRERYAELVELEREEEMERHRSEIRHCSPEERQAKGRALLHMRGRDEGTGLGGLHLVKFVRGGELPDTELSVGDLVMVSRNQPLNPDNPTGTVVTKTNYSLTVAFRHKPHGFVYGTGLRVDLYVNDITFQRMLDALATFDDVSGDRRRLRDILLGKTEPRFSEADAITIRNDILDPSQRTAVERSMEANGIFLIHGPPGTGKTTTLVEAIEQHVERGCSVLATAASNVAVDNIVDFLTDRGLQAVRVGHPARVTETLRHHTLDYLVEKIESYQKAQRLWSRVDDLDEKQERHQFPSGRWRHGMSDTKIKHLAEKGNGSRGVPSEKIEEMAAWIALQEQKNDLVEQAKQLEDEAVDEILERADVICTTNATAGSELLHDRDVDLVAIDEATQATEPSCLIPMTRASKVILAGDHRQLPPTILSEEAKEKGLAETLFERLLEMHGSGIKSMLRMQYRMNTDIMDFPSRRFYDGELTAADAVAQHTLDLDTSGLNGPAAEGCHPGRPVAFIDTDGKAPERSPAGSTSKENKREAAQVTQVANRLLDRGIAPEDVGVISPYDDQVDLLGRMIDISGIEIKTVDGFQGREKDVILLSFVRSNDQGEIGFLRDLRRLNVSITRARKKLVMVGDSATLTEHPTYADLINYVKERGLYVTL